MPVDLQAQVVIDQREAMGIPPLNTLSPAQARINAEARPRSPGPEVAIVDDRSIQGHEEGINVRIYTPAGAGPFPALVWFHGGGWVVGSLDISDGTSRHLCVGADSVVISVDYRLAPEAKFPAAAEDCYAATKWVVDNASSINVDPHRIAVGGDSAGGNLAAVVSLMARDRGGPPLAFQLMVYPVTDREFRTDSYRQNAEGYLLTRENMVWYWDHYLREASDAVNPYAAPMQANDLKGLPPALVITAEFDPLRDEGEAYAKRLEEAGVRTTCSRYDGMVHGFFGMPDMIDKGKEAISQASAALKSTLAR